MERRPIYLDNHASTPCDPRVVEAMLPYFTQDCANASSALHVMGRRAARAVDEARAKVAALVGARASEIIFTSGGTESNNLCLLGTARALAAGPRRQVLVSSIEHKSVLGPARELLDEGFELVEIPVRRSGRIDLAAAADLIDERTLLVSVQGASNEIGTIQPISELARIAHQSGALLHCDAAQAAGRIRVDVSDWGVDFMTLSSHKLYGPQGVGALFRRAGRGRPELRPLMFGGGHEGGLRPGTANLAGIVGFGTACALCAGTLAEEAPRIAGLRDQFERLLANSIPGLTINGDRQYRLPGNCSITLANVEAQALILNLPQLALSDGSACHSGAPDPSHVLMAIGLSRDEAFSTIRVGLGRFTTAVDLAEAAILIAEAYDRLRPDAEL